MVGISMNGLHGNLHLLSNRNFKILKKYFGRNTLTSEELNSLQKEITNLAATSKVPLSQDKKN
jgi:hypothetical protein